MKTIQIKSKQTSILLGVIAMVAIVTLSPHAFAQQNSAGQGQQGGIPLGSSYGSNSLPPSVPTPQDSVMGWAAGITIASVMSGIGAWTAVRKH